MHTVYRIFLYVAVISSYKKLEAMELLWLVCVPKAGPQNNLLVCCKPSKLIWGLLDQSYFKIALRTQSVQQQLIYCGPENFSRNCSQNLFSLRAYYL